MSDPQRSSQDDTYVQDAVRNPSPLELSDAEIEQVKTKATELLRKDTETHNACINLILARRLYSVALHALNRRMDDLGQVQSVEACLAESMKHKAAEEFQRQDLLDQLSRSTLPWLLSEIQAERQREEAAEVAEAAAIEIARRKNGIPLSFWPSKKWESLLSNDPSLPGISRDRTLVLAGHPAVVKHVLRMCSQTALRASLPPHIPRPTVMGLLDAMKDHTMLEARGSRQFVTVGLNRWTGCAKSVGTLHKTLDCFTSLLIGGKIDLCIVDDASQFKESLPTLHPALHVGSLHRTVRKWADESGTALILGLPFESANAGGIAEHWEGVALDDKWSQLTGYTDLVQLVVQPGDNDEEYSIHAMQFNDKQSLLRIGTVAKRLLDSPTRGDDYSG